MAKINHNNYVDTVTELAINAHRKKALFLTAEDTKNYPATVRVEGRELIPFNSNGYLGLEHHPTLVKRAIETIKNYGVQFPISRTFLNTDLVLELEAELSKIFYGRPLITYTSTSLAHISFFPSIIRRNDLIILDQQVHFSVQTAAHLMSHSGTKTTMVRHNNMDMLERFIKSNYEKHEKIWYMADGVYSMFGDLAPVERLNELLTKYPKLYVYADDAHGVGWSGTNGSGTIFEKLKHQQNFILSTTLCKGFGAQGGIIVFPNEDMMRKVKDFGGPLSYSHPLQPPIIGAALGASELFLSDELEAMQNSLKEKMSFFQNELEAAGLPIVSHHETPIFYVGMGRPRTTFNMIRKLIDDGFIVSSGIFPAVPMKCCGLRLGLSNARSNSEISDLVSAIRQNFPNVLEEENVKIQDIYKSFNLEKDLSKEAYLQNSSMLQFDVAIYDDIVRIPRDTWNDMMQNRGVFDYDGLIDQQNLFSDNENEYENFEFYYLIVSDSTSMKPVLASFFTYGIMKDDMLDAPEISKAIEIKRETDKYYLTSKHLVMGSVLTEGEHLYIDRDHSEWKKALLLAIDQIQKLNLKLKANNLLIRDIATSDEEVKEIFINEGFVPVRMPNANTGTLQGSNFTEYLQNVSAKRRKLIKTEVQEYIPYYKVQLVDSPSDEQAKHYYKLYKNIISTNLDINLFPYPENIFSNLKSDNWEYLELYLKPDLEGEFLSKPVGFICAYISGDCYTPLIGGMDYTYIKSHGLYKQLLYRITERAFSLGVSKVYFGLSADDAKRKFGAIAEQKIAFTQITDMFNREVIATMSAAKA